MTRDFWQGIVVGSVIIGGLAAVLTPGRFRRPPTRMEQAERLLQHSGQLVREGGRLVRRRAEQALDRSRKAGKRMMAR